MSLVASHHCRTKTVTSIASALRGHTHLILALAVLVLVAVVLYRPAVTVSSRESAVVRAEGRGKGVFNFRDGRELATEFRGSERGVNALRSGGATPIATAVADLDSNGTPDLITAYASGGIGLVAVQRGNPDAYAPLDESVYPRMQNGYNPDPLLPLSDVYEAPIAIEEMTVGNFDDNSQKDVLIASANGGLYLLKGDGHGRLGVAEQLRSSGTITSLGAGEFGAVDGHTDVALGVSGGNGPVVQLFDASTDKFSQSPMEVPLPAQAAAITFGVLDDDPFIDIAIAAGNVITVVHGAGRKQMTPLQSRVERIPLGFVARGVAIGHFVWDRQAREDLAVLSEDGSVHIIARDDLDTRPYTDAERPTRAKVLANVTSAKSVDVETLKGWTLAGAPSWSEQGQVETGTFAPSLFKAVHMSTADNDDLLIGGADQTLRVVHTMDAAEKGTESIAARASFTTVNLDATAPVVASVMMPKKLNGEGGLILLTQQSSNPTLLPLAVSAIIDVDTTADNAALSACTAAGGDCSLRGAITNANSNVDSTTINVPAGLYVLNINGTSNDGCDGNNVGDLEVNEITTIVGAGAGTTTIRQTAVGPVGSLSARVMCLNNLFKLAYSFSASGVTITGGRSLNSAFGGGGIIGGLKDNTYSFTNITLSNNQATGGTFPGGGIEITGGNTSFTGSLIGGSLDPGADRTNASLANSDSTSGGGVYFTPSSPVFMGSVANLTVTNCTFRRNTAGSLSAGGGGASVEIAAIAGGGGGPGTGMATFTTNTVFNENRALTANGGGLIVASLPTIVSGASFTTNQAGAASGQGGGVYVGSATLHLDGSANAISFSGNTASANGGDSISVNNTTSVSGTLVSIGGDVLVNAQGTWTNNAGSTLAPTNFRMHGGTFNGNNSVMNLSGNLTMLPQPAGTTGVTFNAGSSTVNIGGNFSWTAGGSTPVGSFNAGTGTFNFNGAGAQSISNTASITFNNLTDSNTTQPLILNNSFNVNGTLNVNGVNAIFDPVAAAVIGGTGTLTGTGTSRVRSLSGFSSQYTITNKTLTNLTVEYIGAGAQTGSAITYGPLKINNGSGVNLAAGTTTVNGLLTLTAGALGVGTQTLVINNGSSVVAGSITSSATGTVNYNQGSPGQNVLAFNYGNLTFSNFDKVLANTGTIGIAGTFTPGTAVGHTITGSTVNFNGTGAQTVPAFSFNNLTISGARGVNNVTLVNGGTINVAGTFSPTATFAGGNYVVTNNTMNFNGSGAQTIPAFNYFNLTSSNVGARTLQNSGTIGVQSVFTPGTNSYTVTGSTVSFNGSALQTIPVFTYNNLNLSNAAGANLAGNTTVGAALSLTGGALGVGTNTLTLNGAVSTVAGSLTSAVTGTVIYNQGSNGQATVLAANYGNLTFSNFSKTLSSTGTIGIAGVFTPGSGTGHTITGSTINFNGAGAQTIPGFTYNNLTSSGGAAARTLDPVNTIRIAGVFTPGTNVYTITGSTVEYNGTAAQTLPNTFTTYNNLTLNNPAGTTGFAGLTVQGLLTVAAGTFTSSSNYNNVQINAGATLAGVAATTINVTGNWTNNGGTFTPNGNTVNFNGTGSQTIGGTGSSTFNNLTVNNANGLSMASNNTVNAVLALTAADLTVAPTFVLTQPAAGSSTGTFDVIGSLRRTGFVSGGAALSFGNPFNTIQINSGTAPTDITVNLAKTTPPNPIGFPNAVQRTYDITATGGSGISATLRLHYLDSELNGNTEGAGLNLWQFVAPLWRFRTITAFDTTNNWVEKSGVTGFSPWTMNSTNAPTATNGVISGRITNPDGSPVAGAVVRLTGTQNRKTITDANGGYIFNGVETSGFYTIIPSRANYTFSPSERSFSQVGEQTDASFNATSSGDTANPLDTPEYFVRQQYVDLLGREPDEGGFNYWSDRILECGAAAQCVSARRRDVAAAFFIEQEFQQTGSFIYGLYKGSLGRVPAFTEFSSDRSGLVVGPQLDAMKQAYAESFVARPEFVSKYAANTSAESFVDALLATVQQASGMDLSSQRAAMIARYNSGGSLEQSRSFAVREVTESAVFRQTEYNGAFVLTEYFGYLRRDPDPGGYDFWLNVLNNRDPGNFRGMVCAFITSAEYQQRFSAIISRNDHECGQ